LHPIGKEKYIGKIETGTVHGQLILVRNEAGEEHTFRKIRVKLKSETRDGDTEIFIITNLSKRAVNAKTVAKLYRDRWTIETACQRLAEYFNSEINTLGYPRAAFRFLRCPGRLYLYVRCKSRAGQCAWCRLHRTECIWLLCGQ